MEREETPEEDTRKMLKHVFRTSGSLRKDNPYNYLKPPRSIKRTEKNNKDFMTSNYRTKHIFAPARMDLHYFQTEFFFPFSISNDTIKPTIHIFAKTYDFLHEKIIMIFFISRLDHRRNSRIFPQLTVGSHAAVQNCQTWSIWGVSRVPLADRRCSVKGNLVVTIASRDGKRPHGDEWQHYFWKFWSSNTV